MEERAPVISAKEITIGRNIVFFAGLQGLQGLQKNFGHRSRGAEWSSKLGDPHQNLVVFEFNSCELQAFLL